MMPGIDASIYNNLQPVKIATPFENAAMLSQIQQGQNQNRLSQMAFTEADRVNSERNALAGIAKQYGNTPEYGNQLLKGGHVDAYQNNAKFQSEQGKRTLEETKAKIEAGLQQFSAIGQIMSGVRDQPSYDAAKQQVVQILGPDAAANMPPAYDPQIIEQGRVKALSVKDQMEQQHKAISEKLDVEKFGYQQKHDAAALGVTMRGQDFNHADSVAGRAQSERNSIRADNRAANPVAKPAKPMPSSALKMQGEELDAIGTAASINADLGTVESQLKTGKLKLGPLDNLVSKGRNMAGISDESSRNFSSFQATLEKLRNDSLRLNKGVQTDGDAQRAWNELMKNINDPEVVKQRLGEIKKINARAVNIRRMNVDNIRANYGAEPLDTSRYSAQPSALGGASLPGGWTVKEH